MAPLVRTDEDNFRSLIVFQVSSIYDMMLSLGTLHSPNPRHERWAQQLRTQLPREVLQDVDFLYSRFENGVLLMELAVDYPNHHDVPGFLAHVEAMSIPQFLFYVLGRLAPPEEMARLAPTVESLLSLIPGAFPEGSAKTESRFRTEGFLELVAEPETHKARMLRLWKRYWETYFAEQVDHYTDLWEESIREKSRALAEQDAEDFVKRLSNHPRLPDQIPTGYSTGEIVLVPSYFARHTLMFYGYGSVTLIYDCQLTEQRRGQLEILEDEITATAKAIGDKTRLKLLRLIVENPHLYGRELAKHCQVSQPSVSRHLRILKEADLLVERPVGNHITYEVRRQRIEGLAPQLISYLYGEE
jgi:DNA-binding transcriptional ArsR family regulator